MLPTRVPRSLGESIERLGEVEPGPEVFGELLGHGDEAVPPLESFLCSRPGSVPQPRSMAAEILAAIGSPAATAALRRALVMTSAREGLDPVLADAERTVISDIADRLGALKDSASFDPLVSAFRRHPCPGCARALGRLGDVRAVPLLAEHLLEDSVRAAVTEALRGFGNAAAAALSRILLRRWDRESLEPGPWVAGRAAAAGLLGETTAENALLPLVWSLFDAAEKVRLAAAAALVERGYDAGEVALPTLIELLGSADWLDAERAGDALVALGPSAVAGLARAATTPTSGLTRRRRAVEILPRVDGESVIAPLVECGRDSDVQLRLTAAIALGSTRSTRALEALRCLTRDQSPEVRRRAVQGLARYGAPALDSVALALGDPDPGVRQTAGSALADAGPVAAAVLRRVWDRRHDHSDGRLGAWRARREARRLLVRIAKGW
jgi:HEAT repeat protein